MDPSVVISILLLGTFNTVSSIYFLGQSTSTALIGFGISIAVLAVTYASGIKVTKSNWSIITFTVVANLIIIGGVFSTYLVKGINERLYTVSKKFVKQQAEYKKLLD